MIQEIQLNEAEKKFRELVEKSIQGSEFIIVTDNIPVARIVPVKEKTFSKKPGTGQVVMKDDFKGPDNIRELEEKHRQGYMKKPVMQGEFSDWEEEQAWPE